MRRKIAIIAGLLCISVSGVLFWEYRNSNAGNDAEAGTTSTAAPAGHENPVVPVAPGAAEIPLSSDEYLRGSRARGPVDLLEDWLGLAVKKDSVNRASAAGALAEMLHNNALGRESAYRRARQVLQDPSISLEIKQELLRLLSRAATPLSAQLFADFSRQELPEALRQALNSSISEIGDYFWDKESAGEAAPVLLQLWLESRDPQLLNAVASAMSKVGSQEAIDGLFEAVLNHGGTLEDIQKSSDPQTAAALSALRELHGPDVLPSLTTRLNISSSSVEIAICAGIMASMGQIEATQSLMAWAQKAGDSSAPIVRDTFARIPFGESLDYVTGAIAQNVTFSSSLVRQAVISALKRP